MALEWIDRTTRIVRLRIRGELTGADMKGVQEGILATIAKFGSASGLVLLEGFEGWKSGEDWGDLSFQEEHDREIERIAVVGEQRWRDDMLAFLVAPFRSAEVRYFDEGELASAEAWIAQ